MAENHVEQNGTHKPRLGWRITRLVGLGIGGVLLAALFALLLGVIVQWLWNWLMPAVFGLKQITFWQAVGLLFLSKLLFGGFRHHPTHHSGKHFSSDHADRWKSYRRFWQEKGEKATEDLIDQFRKEKGVWGKQ